MYHILFAVMLYRQLQSVYIVEHTWIFIDSSQYWDHLQIILLKYYYIPCSSALHQLTDSLPTFCFRLLRMNVFSQACTGSHICFQLHQLFLWRKTQIMLFGSKTGPCRKFANKMITKVSPVVPEISPWRVITLSFSPENDFYCANRRLFNRAVSTLCKCPIL